MTDDATKRKITYISTDLHPSESAIVVNYYLQLISVSDSGKQTPGERKAMQKSIKVSVSDNMDITGSAREIIEKYPKLIPAIKMRDLETALISLRQRGGSIPDVRSKSRNDDEVGTLSAAGMLDNYTRNRISSGKEESASMDMVEQYIEGLYEEIPDKITSTRNILSLAKDPRNLDTLMENESLISAISRVLREDNKKSMELVTNIIYIFFCFSNFPQYHPFITANKLGDMCLRITDQELNRFDLWSTDIQKLELKSIQNPDNGSINRELEKEHRKFQAMIRKQDQLLFVCFHLLLNLAEDLTIEVKMVKRDITRYLVTILDRETPELLVLAITFLKKLSIFKENKDELVQSDAVFTKLEKILCIENPALQGLSLKLLLNLSHDKSFRLTMVRNGCISKIAELLNSKTHVILSLQLLYQLSIDDQNRDLMSVDSAVVPLILRMILEFRGEKVNTELMAVAINLATSPCNAQTFVADQGLKFLVRRALKTKDTLILKLLRNVSMHGDSDTPSGEIKFLFLDFIDELMMLLLKNIGNPDVFVEVVGILGQLDIPDFDFAKLAQAYGLVEMVQKKLANAVAAVTQQQQRPDKKRIKKGDTRERDEDPEPMEGLMENDDVTLEAIILLGTMAHDENIAPMVAKTEIIPLMMDLMIIKEEDDEIVLQIIYCIYLFLLYESTRTILINKTQVVSYLIDLLYDRNHQIRRMCDTCLDIISEINEDWIQKIKHQKFQWHNSEYLTVMAELLEQQQEEEAAMTQRQQYQQQTSKSKKGSSAAGLGNVAPRGEQPSPQYRNNQPQRKVVIGNNTYYSGLDESDNSDDDEEFARQIGGTSAILDGP